MKNFFFVFLLLGFISCKKESTSDPVIEVAAKTITNVAYGTDPAQSMDIYLPKGRTADSTKLIIMIHGGAWLSGDKSEFTGYIPKIQQLFPGYAIANMNYRLASLAGNYFPSHENDVKSAVDFLLQKRTEYLFNDKIILFGASAGGHLATLQAYKYSIPKIKAVVDFFGPADMVDLYNTTTDFQAKAGLQILMGGTPSTNPQLYFSSSPVNYVNAQSPPTIILHGDQDIIVNVNQSIALKNKLQTAGVPVQLEIYPGMGHDPWPDAVMDNALAKVKVFISTYVH
jgi:acetyl esterase/lipase